MTMTLIPTATLEVLLDRLPIAYDAQNDEQLYEAIVETQRLITTPDRPTVVVNITGGVLQGASATSPVDVYALDFETNSCDENLVWIEGSDAYCYEAGALVDPEFVQLVVDAKAEVEGKEDD